MTSWENLLRNENHCSIYSVFEKVIQENREKEGFVFCDRSSGELVLRRWTFGQIEEGKKEWSGSAWFDHRTNIILFVWVCRNCQIGMDKPEIERKT